MENQEQNNQNQSFDIKLPADAFYNMMAGVANLSDEAILILDTQGATVRTMDPSSISMVITTVPKQAFPLYNLGKDKKEIKLGLNFEDIVSKLPKKDGMIEIKGTENKLKIYTSGGNIDESHEIKTIDVKPQPDKEPTPVYTIGLELEATKVKEILAKAKKLKASHITITTTQQDVSFMYKTPNTEMPSTFTISRDKIEPHKFSVSGSNPISASYNVDYLVRMIKQASKTTTVEIQYANEEPLRMSYKLNDVKLSFIVAPYMSE